MAKLSVSNIIWEQGTAHLPDFLERLQRARLDGVELALSCFWEEPAHASRSDVSWLRQELASRSLAVSALHSVTFTRPDLELFGGSGARGDLRDYVLRYVELARELDCRNIVFGSPRARRMHDRAREECDDIFLEFWRDLDRDCDGVFLNIEPLPKGTCEYLHTFAEAHSLLSRISIRNVKIQLDVRAVMESQENLDEILVLRDWIRHCQVSDPGLRPPENERHGAVARQLYASGYDGFVAAEVTFQADMADREAGLDATIAQLKGHYLI